MAKTPPTMPNPPHFGRGGGVGGWGGGFSLCQRLLNPPAQPARREICTTHVFPPHLLCVFHTSSYSSRYSDVWLIMMGYVNFALIGIVSGATGFLRMTLRVLILAFSDFHGSCLRVVGIQAFLDTMGGIVTYFDSSHLLDSGILECRRLLVVFRPPGAEMAYNF